MTVAEKGYAKINLGLEVIKRRYDSYHELSMIMTTIDLCDELYFEDAPRDICVINYDQPVKRDIKDDLIYKAYVALKEKYNIEKGLKVSVIKRIPEQAGLGGGSADAAATLRALNKLWRLGLSLDELARLGFQIGSDIPFCIYNKTAKISGRGEKIEFIDECPRINLVLVFPDFKCSTAEVFSSFQIHLLNKGKTDVLMRAIAGNNINDIARAVFNDLEHSRHFLEIKTIKETLVESGALGASMTGSGSAVYGFCHSNKSARAVMQKFKKLSEGRLDNADKYALIVTATRSGKRPYPIEKENDNGNEPRSGEAPGFGETKAYGMIKLFYRRVLDHYQMIVTPLCLYDNVYVERTEPNKTEVYFDGVKDASALSSAVGKIADVIGYGLLVKIKSNVDRRFNLITNENYLSAIISAVAALGENADNLYRLFDKTAQIYRGYRTALYDSKTREITVLCDAVFCYAALVPLGLNNYRSPRYTRQIDNNPAELNEIITAITKKNFYEMASAVYNGVGGFDARKINALKGFDFCGQLEEISVNNRAGGFLIAPGGQYAIALFRFKKYAERYVNFLKRKYRLQGVVTSLKSKVTHQLYVNVYLKTETELRAKVAYIEEDEDYNPFGDFLLEVDGKWEKHGERKQVKKVPIKINVSPATRKKADLEGILYLQSGGSIFKQYDFIDIADYFKKYFHNKYIVLVIDGKIIPVKFDVAHLPHILGMHYLDPSIQGRKGFEKLETGELSYDTLKRTHQKILRSIAERTHSSVLILNDIIHNRLYNICCFDRSVILRGSSNNEKFEYGITRMLTSTMFRRQNLLGIGKDSNADKYFFQTSYIWNVPANIGKKDSLTISVLR